MFDQLKNVSGGVSAAINESVIQLSQKRDRKKVEADLYNTIKEAIQKELKLSA